jgi:hypothetical protein
VNYVLNKLEINCLTMNFEYYKLYITSTHVTLPSEFKQKKTKEDSFSSGERKGTSPSRRLATVMVVK